MKILQLFSMMAVWGLGLSTAATAGDGDRCRITDPTGTPLNVRTAPYGAILGTVRNGALVSVIDQRNDQKGKPWVYVADYDTNQPIGWVYREYISCF